MSVCFLKFFTYVLYSTAPLAVSGDPPIKPRVVLSFQFKSSTNNTLYIGVKEVPSHF